MAPFRRLHQRAMIHAESPFVMTQEGVFSEDGSRAVLANGHLPRQYEGLGLLAGFRFLLTHSKPEAGQTAAGTLTFDGSLEEAAQVLREAGFRERRGTHCGSREFRTRGSWLTGAESAHFLLYEKPINKLSQTDGEFHFGEHNPYSPLGWLIHWIFEAYR